MTNPASSPDLEAFHRDGFVVIRGLFSPVEVEEMRGAFDRLALEAQRLPASGLHRGSQFVVEAGDPIRIHRVVWCGAAEPVLSRLGCAPRLLEVAAALVGSRELEQLINQAHFKLPGDDVGFPWHQDSTHRRYGTSEWTDLDGSGSFVEIATALDPVGADNGPLRFVPGSHRLGHVPVGENGELPTGTFDPTSAVAPELAPGDAVAFGPFVVHGSEPNGSARPRRMFLNGFAVPGANARVYPGEGSGRRVRA